MKKYFIFIVIALLVTELEADTSEPYGDNPVGYLESKDVIVYGVKLAGPVSYGDYADYFNNVQSQLSEETIKQNWQSQMASIIEKFLVLKVLKGDEIEEGSVIEMQTSRALGRTRTRIRDSYILFLNSEQSGIYSYEICDFANIYHLSNDWILEIISLDYSQATERLVQENLMGCAELAVFEEDL